MIAGFLDPYTQAYPEKMKTKVEIKMKDGKTFSCEKEDYHGFFTRPFSWDDTIAKFRRLCERIIDNQKQDEIIAVTRNLENLQISELIDLICTSLRTK